MKYQYFVDHPSLDLYKGIQVQKDTEVTFKNEKVDQCLKDLKLETVMTDEGSNGINSYKSESRILVTLNEGDILLFNPDRGYYLPSYPKTTIEQAIEDISSLKDTPLPDDQE